VQVSLGDLFARAATDNGSVFLIETHSEHLILRLLRRSRETAEGELPPGLRKSRYAATVATGPPTPTATCLSGCRNPKTGLRQFATPVRHGCDFGVFAQ
jgi:hypothetical protein